MFIIITSITVLIFTMVLILSCRMLFVSFKSDIKMEYKITRDKNGLVIVWNGTPSYSDDEETSGRWHRTNEDYRRGGLESIIGFGPFKEYADTISLQRGPMGIATIAISIELLGEVPTTPF